MSRIFNLSDLRSFINHYHRRTAIFLILECQFPRHSFLTLFNQAMLRRLSHVFGHHEEMEVGKTRGPKIRVKVDGAPKELTEEQAVNEKSEEISSMEDDDEKLNISWNNKNLPKEEKKPKTFAEMDEKKPKTFAEMDEKKPKTFSNLKKDEKKPKTVSDVEKGEEKPKSFFSKFKDENSETAKTANQGRSTRDSIKLANQKERERNKRRMEARKKRKSSHGLFIKDPDSKKKGKEMCSQTDFVISAHPEDISLIIKQRLKKHELIIARREKEHELRFMKGRLSHLQLVLHNLWQGYKETRGQCPCCRYPEMKDLIKLAIENYHDRNYEKTVQRADGDPIGEVIGGIEDAVTAIRRLSIASNAMNMFKMSEDEIIDNMMEMEEELHAYQRKVTTEERKIKKLIRAYHDLSDKNICSRYSYLQSIIEEACMDCVKE